MRQQRGLSRRGFVGVAAGSAAATTMGPWAPTAGASRRGGRDRLLPRDRIGIQLYMVRDGSFSTAERSYAYLTSLRERA